MSDLIRKFDTGATRSAEADKLDYEGFLSPVALEVFAKYMHIHRHQADGTLRSSDNWQKGIPLTSYVKSLVRHVIDLWSLERGHVSTQVQQDFSEETRLSDIKLALAAAIWFNIQGYIVERKKQELPPLTTLPKDGSASFAQPVPESFQPSEPYRLGINW